MNIIERVLNRKEITEDPPVLLDIGASGRIHPRWRKIAGCSVCIAFDADKRDFDYVTEESDNYKELYVYNCIVSDNDSGESDFYLTKSPHCSSLLEPDNESLKEWSFSSLFEIEEKIRVSTKNLRTVLKNLEIDKIDWFKTDAQGIDLRLFKILGEEIIRTIKVAEFEPGIMDAYKNEDKLYEILAYMDEQKQFWLSDFVLKGSQRIPENEFKTIFKTVFTQKLARHSLKKSPGWAELVYMNSFDEADRFSLRDYLLGWLFSTIEEQHGFALKLARQAENIFGDRMFLDLYRSSRRRLKSQLISSRLIPHVKTKMMGLLKR